MKKYRVRVVCSASTIIDVEAESEDEARTRAQERAGWGFHDWTHSPRDVIGSAVLASGPPDEPLVPCPTEWEIYTSMPGHEEANAAITRAVKLVAKALLKRKAVDLTPDLVVRLARKQIAPCLNRYGKFGTYDTEPRANIASYLSKYAKELGSERADDIYDAVRWDI